MFKKLAVQKEKKLVTNIVLNDKTYIQYFRGCYLNFPLKIQPCDYLTKKYTSIPWAKIHMTEF